jgi:chromosome segregation ATPase
VAGVALIVSVIAEVSLLRIDKRLREISRITDQVTGNTRQLQAMGGDVRTLKTAVAGLPDGRQLDILSADVSAMKLDLPAEIARQSQVAADAMSTVRDAVSDLSEHHNDLRHDFDTLASGRSTSSDVQEFRVRLDLTENAARQAQSRISEVAEQIERVEERQDRH